MSASSWQGLLVAPEGAPAPPECLAANQTRGRHTPSRFTTPRDSAPQRMRQVQAKGAGERGDKFLVVIPANADIQLAPEARKKNWTPGFAGVTQVG